MIQWVTPEGKLTKQGLKHWSKFSNDEKREWLRWMILARQFDRRAILLQRQGRIGTYAPLEGQEAAQIGSSMALHPEDWVFPSYREHGVALKVGMPISQVFLYWMGRVEGCKPPEGVRLMPPTVPIATQIPQAVGAAWASKLRKETFVSVAYFGDGATSEGDFHEGLNFAGVFKLPVIFFCQNNGYAISVPFNRQSASETIAERAKAYQIPGVLVDGNDVFAVRGVMEEAIARARKGDGPTLIEAVTYRKGSHTTADDATRYRPSDEVKEWIEERDPVERWRACLLHEGLISLEEVESWTHHCDEQVDLGIKEAESSTPALATHLFEYVYHEVSRKLMRQKTECETREIPWLN
ncbi:pyruvate dehydrogenase (acetyl-transferring) E1 component subunit alpha [Baia soyae]|uniref:Pyruvate dehydrogenase E1 component subunit alpha n=1 Tax=Baia soyae TaxID=1544746 RepID=A0A4R2RJW8_9BACL|nr:pyruvate dehydrogenase (acetyl-transferring) E1 component subunit alpha [Baia soyae]TCP62477.1 pyruvate dehydrogenase E1 component alpha subunit [Baia soyae]